MRKEYYRKSPIERFLSKIHINDSGCWELPAWKNQYGYGQFSIKNKIFKAHRFIYEYYHGAICPDLTIDHLCRNRKCCNPLHLEQVTKKENMLRGIGITALNAKKTHCIHGHEFNEENTWYIQGGRRCKTCNYLRHKKFMELRVK